MEPDDAAEHLQVIRTLMERSALYRRTLAPIMVYVGSVGVLAGLGGLALGIDALRAFCAWWFGVAALAVAGAFAVARWQALQDGEPFWSPPTVRATQAIVLPLAAGLLLDLALLVLEPRSARHLFVLANVLFYGCAVHAAGFFMPRGLKAVAWCLTALGAAIFFVGLVGDSVSADLTAARLDHLIMGGLFGVVQLAYGLYLHATKPRKTAA